MAQDSKELIDFIRENHLFPPNKKPYNLSSPEISDPTSFQVLSKLFIPFIFKNKVNSESTLLYIMYYVYFTKTHCKKWLVILISILTGFSFRAITRENLLLQCLLNVRITNYNIVFPRLMESSLKLVFLMEKLIQILFNWKENSNGLE